MDAALPGSRAEDVGYLLTQGATMEVVDPGGGRRYAVSRGPGLGVKGALAARLQVVARGPLVVQGARPAAVRG